jgi:integrase/recombinase XerC
VLSEVGAAGLELSDFKTRAQSLRVRGKGNRQRIAYIPARVQAALEAWLRLRGRRPGGLFWGVTKGGKLTYRHVSPQLIYRVVQKRHLAAGIAEFTPHDLRRSHISDLLDEGGDLAVIARQVGHSNVQTTARYDRRGRRAQRIDAERLDVPFETDVAEMIDFVRRSQEVSARKALDSELSRAPVRRFAAAPGADRKRERTSRP